MPPPHVDVNLLTTADAARMPGVVPADSFHQQGAVDHRQPKLMEAR